MKYVKKFNNHNDYNTYITGNPVLPNISYCETLNEIHYNPIYDYSKDYLTFIALENGTFTFTPKNNNVISYSINNGETWTTGNSVNVTTGDKILWKGEMTSKNGIGIGKFSATGNFNVQGNIMSLLYGDNYKGQTDLTGKDYVFDQLFYQNTKIVNAKDLSLPVITLADSCYQSMFKGCTALTTAPALSATTLAGSCYQSMFQGCTSLTTAPKLHTTTLAAWCYANMFQGCTSLTTAPKLPATILVANCYKNMFTDCTALTTAPILSATTLASNCYNSMFKGCTVLTTAPELPATTLNDSCYGNMFYGCISLTTAPELPATTLAYYCYSYMFYGCISLTTAPELPATTLANGCYSYMFYGCTSLTTVPELPATTLTSNCYNYMFYDCTSLTTAPELPAVTLTDYCYYYMFRGCTSLNYIKAMFTTTPSSKYTSSWVYNVASTGTFVKNANATWTTTGNNGVPTGWTVQTASE